ncbi:hypothetical protein AYI69_g598 [Smittium culicis]|uniref:Uncharacterized protein n=1 Tax=Smittium culicis TaxID=133412 RepID=A0A1R1YSW2_9FUNG|nr:hypothetical protein AYI69_g598 [Smittium culicis]
MSRPTDAIDVIEKQILKGGHKQSELDALSSARSKITLYSISGGVLGLAGGLYLSKLLSLRHCYFNIFL